MVHATVTREPNNSFTVTFGDANSPEAASGAQPNKISATSPASSKNASTANVNMRKAQAIEMAEEVVTDARRAVVTSTDAQNAAMLKHHEAEKKPNNITAKNEYLKAQEVLLNTRNLAYKAASKGITAIVMLRALGLEPNGMQAYLTEMVKQSRNMRDSNDSNQFSIERDLFSKAVDGFAKSIETVKNKDPVSKIANSSNSKKADAVRMAHAAIQEAKQAIIGYDPTKLHSNSNLQERLIKTVNALQGAAEAAMEAAAMNDTNIDMTTYSKEMMDRANLLWINIKLGSDKLSQTIEHFKQSTAAFSNAAGINLSNAATSASNSVAASSGMNQLKAAKTVWKSVIDEVDRGIQAVSTYSETEPQRALEEAGKLSTKLTTSFKVIENAVKNNPVEQQIVEAEKKGISKKISDIFKTLGKRGVPSKGGRRTHRKRTHRKRTHRKRKSIQKIE